MISVGGIAEKSLCHLVGDNDLFGFIEDDDGITGFFLKFFIELFRFFQIVAQLFQLKIGIVKLRVGV